MITASGKTRRDTKHLILHAYADKAMAEVFDAVYASLHVRVSNRGAFHLYTQTLGYECVSTSSSHPFTIIWMPPDVLLPLAMHLAVGISQILGI